MTMPAGAQLSEDGNYWWDGAQWQPVSSSTGEAGQISPDGNYRWDGTAWQPMAQSDTTDAAGPDDAGSTPVDVVYEVGGMSQPTDHSCWATSFAVVINYRDGSNLTPADVSNAVGVDIAAAESWQDVTNAAHHFNLRESASACMNVQGWAELLASYGPLWLCINGGSHAVVLNGAQGDGTAEGTRFYVTDPWSGPTTAGLDGLAAMFEALNAHQPGDGLVIWHS
jgi:hypothetical protein